MRTAFIENENETRFTHNGYLVVDLLNPGELVDVQKIVKELGFGREHEEKLRISVTHESVDKKKEIFERLSPVFQSAANKFLKKYKIIRIGIFDKLPKGDGIRVHQHPNLVDESKYRSLTFWVPLKDTSVEMGTLHVVKGSHNIFNHVRSYNDHCAFLSVSSRVMNKYSTPLLLKEGQAAIMDERLIHWSPPNKSPRIRTALQLMSIPSETELTVHYRENEHELLKYEVSDKTFREATLILKKPDDLQLIGKVNQSRVSYSSRQFKSMMQGVIPGDIKQGKNLIERLFNL